VVKIVVHKLVRRKIRGFRGRVAKMAKSTSEAETKQLAVYDGGVQQANLEKRLKHPRW
jgi:hypothetical protein